MKNIKKDIPAIAGLLATVSTTVISGGLVNPVVMSILGTVGSIGTGLIANRISNFKTEKWFENTHPDNLNHSIKKLFVESIKEALSNINILFSETQVSDNEKKEAKQLINTLQKQFLSSSTIQLEEP
jgi:hypothetical protein